MNLILDRNDIKHIQNTNDWLKSESNQLDLLNGVRDPDPVTSLLNSIVKRQELLFSSVQKIITNSLKENVLNLFVN